MTIRTRLTLSYAGAIGATLALAGVAVWWQLGAMLRASLDQTLQTRAADVATSLENAGQVGLQQSNATAPGVFTVIVDGTGHLVDATAGAPVGLPMPAAGAAREVRQSGVTYLLRAVNAPDGDVVVAGSSLVPIERAQASLALVLLVVGLGAGLLSLLGGWWLAGRALRPVAALTLEAAAIGAADLDRRLPETATNDELGRLAHTLNGMLDRLERGLRQQRTFVAAASHDLRSPLAALQAELELADRSDADATELRSAIVAAHADTVRLGDFATALLELSTAETDGRALVRRPVRVGELVESVVARTAAIARQRRVAVVQRACEREVEVDRVRVEQAISNLLTNAILYSPLGSQVDLLADVDDASAGLSPAGPRDEAGRAHGGVLVVEILDRGPGLPDAVREHLFEPFQRGPNATGPGFGLGLATAAAGVRAHRGTIGAEPRDGGGTRFWFRVPAGTARKSPAT
ncbi:MAG: HAMP domain-containing sensor histidine kinase [Chloroflexi bacterium]|nr:HAMP domain-containing sensor histidine kinase [Chloroflexota bacterium]